MISRVRIDAYGPNAADVEAQLLAFASACDSTIGAAECAHGEMVIERQLAEEYGTSFAFKGRTVIHPDIGRVPFIPAAVLEDQKAA